MGMILKLLNYSFLLHRVLRFVYIYDLNCSDSKQLSFLDEMKYPPQSIITLRVQRFGTRAHRMEKKQGTSKLENDIEQRGS